jgi:hypothetical protein
MFPEIEMTIEMTIRNRSELPGIAFCPPPEA